ncbi:NUDIX domain-containing protein [Paenibacillus sp. N1-5-1-14]|uniref:NUDIX hydrolase n=1 Tax=Paenibacillus radicibacter TaxID=2972488 RepID=UPI002158DF31|nr:NUDIX domain-containing protein [Paenibacillus radicibacter]MCR8645695.1 NUDIX domain-containing protein [Paenibacillus radicibacter]
MLEISAGGVVYRKVNGELQIQMIKDRFGKMTLAKGKMEPGETIEQTAIREIWEETGITSEIRDFLEMIKYQFSHHEKGDVDKEVHYYLLEAISGDTKAQIEEIGEVHWLAPMDAWREQLGAGYDNNDSVLRLGLEKLGIVVE